jgi:WD40 repeat protein
VAAPRPIAKSEPVSRRLTRTLIHRDRHALFQSILFDPDGKWIAGIVFQTGEVVFWDAATGQQQRTIPPIPEDYLAPVIGDGLPAFVNGRTLFLPIRRTQSVRILKDGKPAVRWEIDGEIRVLDLTTARPMPSLRHKPPRGPRGVAFSPDGTRLAALEECLGAEKEARPKSVITLWDVRARTSRDLAQSLSVPCFSPDGKTLAGSFEGYEIKRTALALWDVASGKRKTVLDVAEPTSNRKSGYDIPVFSLDGRYLAVSLRPPNGQPGQVKLWEVATGKEVGSFTAADKLSSFGPLAFSPDGRRLGAICDHGKAFLYDVRARKLAWVRDLGTQAVLRHPVFSPDGKWLALAVQHIPEDVRRPRSENPLDLPQARVLLFDLTSGGEPEVIVAPHGFAGWCAFRPDSRTLALGAGGCIWLFDMTKKQ